MCVAKAVTKNSCSKIIPRTKFFKTALNINVGSENLSLGVKIYRKLNLVVELTEELS